MADFGGSTSQIVVGERRFGAGFDVQPDRSSPAVVPSTLPRPFRPGNFADYGSKHLPIAARLWWRLEPVFDYNRSHKPRLTHGCLFASGHHGPTVDTFERERCSLVSVLSVV